MRIYFDNAATTQPYGELTEIFQAAPKEQTRSGIRDIADREDASFTS